MCKKYGHNNHKELKSEILAILLELPKSKQETIAENNYLIPYALQTLRFQVSNKNWTAFRKAFGNRENIQYNATIDGIEVIDEEYTENTIDPYKVVNQIETDMIDQNNKYFYHSRLLNELIITGANIKQLSREIGIPYTSVIHAIKEYRQHLKKCLK
jgi:hypothetical protein